MSVMFHLNAEFLSEEIEKCGGKELWKASGQLKLPNGEKDVVKMVVEVDGQ